MMCAQCRVLKGAQLMYRCFCDTIVATNCFTDSCKEPEPLLENGHAPLRTGLTPLELPLEQSLAPMMYPMLPTAAGMLLDVPPGRQQDEGGPGGCLEEVVGP